MKFLWISFNISEPMRKMIFPQLLLLQLWRQSPLFAYQNGCLHIISSFEFKYLENQRWYWKMINGILSYFIRSYIWGQHVFWWTFPLSDHKLEIESGRHIRPKINRENKTCKLCSKPSKQAPIEVEVHFITRCDNFMQTEKILEMNFPMR